MHGTRLVALDELIEILPRDRRLLLGEVLVRPQVIDPKLVGPWIGTAFFFVEEKHVGLHARRIPDACGQAEQGMNVAFFKQILAYLLAGSALKEHVIWQNHCRLSAILQDGTDMLNKVELLVRGGFPEVLPLVDE